MFILKNVYLHYTTIPMIYKFVRNNPFKLCISFANIHFQKKLCRNYETSIFELGIYSRSSHVVFHIVQKASAISILVFLFTILVVLQSVPESIFHIMRDFAVHYCIPDNLGGRICGDKIFD